MENDTNNYVNQHYYGDYVRKIFFAIGIFMLLGLPLFSKDINVGGYVPVLGIIAVGLFAGMTSPRKKFVILSDSIISLIGTGFFELTAYFRFDYFGSFSDMYFWFNEILAVLFFVALYLSIKTFRGMSSKE